MIISVNWLNKYLKKPVDIKMLTERIGARLVEIESVESLADKYSPAIVVKVVECIDHPDSDHMHICKIDDNNIATTAPRDDNGFVQVVCGAPNVHVGMLAVWLPPESIVPESYGADDEFKLSSRKLRGVMSHGMLASPRELALWNEHEGIMEIDDTNAKPGDKLTDLLELNDYLLEVENKSLTHRPDCFGMVGFAREVAAILGEQMETPEWINNLDGKIDVDSNDVTPTVAITDPKLCSRYECIALANVDSSRNLPLSMRSLVARSGANSIDAPVDITNYLMFETGQPLHAFDLDKVIAASPTGKPDIVIRAAVKGETLELLDGKTIELNPKDIIIAAGNAKQSIPIALAGAMGGMSTEITPETKRVLLESATFDLYHLRGTQFRHGIFSEAITRFTKGQPAELTHPVLLRAVEMMRQYAGAKVISAIASDYPSPVAPSKFSIPAKRFTDVLGEYKTGYTPELIKNTLQNLQYVDVELVNDTIHAIAPWWRTDLHIDEDVIEDVGRVNGYDDIVATSPLRRYIAAPYDKLYQKQMWLRNQLLKAGGNEVMTYSFVHGDLLNKVGDDKEQAYRIVNAISPDLQYYRRDLLPNLLASARDNIHAGYDNFLLFELGKVHRQGLMDANEPELPAEIPEVAGIVIDKNHRTDSAYYSTKKIVDYALGIDSAQLVYTRLDQSDVKLDGSINLFEPARSAVLTIVNNGETNYVGVVGEFKHSIKKAFKLPDFCAGFTLLTAELLDYLDDGSVYTPVMRYQGTARDITYQVNVDTTYADVFGFTSEALSSKLGDHIVYNISARDIYNVDSELKNITLHIDFHDPAKTIDAKLVGKTMDYLANQAEKKINAKVI